MATPLHELPDHQLWKCFQQGNREALREIYFKHYALLYNYGKKLTAHPEIAEDCIQDLFLKLWVKRSNLSEVVSIRSYLFKAYRRILLDLVRINRKYANEVDLPSEYDVSLSVERLTIQKEQSAQQLHELTTAINNLSKRQKEIIFLCFYKGFSYREIAEIIPIKYQTIRNCVYEAVKVLRKSLTKVS